ncbi:MHYT domain-containing protein [uncultured Massilia sp.]|uniref:MHYT domain-containing protein n=1 Tax=uncultured Massilia sp. TaxID=169973 RepID=UPI0025EDB4ED|nr:MHYT domain-containing protein [uncultured Massilia sp.]
MLSGYYEMSLVLVSILVAMVASYSALGLAGRVAQSQGRALLAWTAGGAVAMGSGIWAMHFIGMLAFRLPIPLAFDVPITIVSLLLPIAASGLALWQAGRADLGGTRLLVSAVLMGIGINAMHYTGMAALRMRPGIVYDPWLFALSVLVAIAASALALWIAFRLRRNTPRVWLPRAGAAVAMGAAIAGMHYTGMAAASFPADSVCMAARAGVNHSGVATLVVIASLCVLGLALAASVFDARLQANARILAVSQAMAEERQQLLLRERAARDEAEHLSAMKDEFLATLSHELRTPLNAIAGWAGMLRRGVRDEATVKRGLDAIERNARAQGQLIDDLLDMSRIVSGNLRLEVQPVDPARIVDSALGTVHPAAVAKQIALRTDIDRGIGEMLADPGRLQQVMWNLLSNAVKFTPAGGTVQVTLGRERGDVVLRVIDSGIGIAPEFLPYVFDRFRQQDASVTRRHGGLGLGLSIVRQLVELHGGTIEADSPGAHAGAAFTVRLPLLRPQPAAAAAQAAAHDAAVAARSDALADLSGVKVLVVDDAPDTLDVLEQILRHSGASTLAASGAGRALDLLERERPDVIVSDIGMPGTDGYELMRSIRRRAGAAGGAVPAIALTAFTRQEDRERALGAGYTDYLAKPVDAGLLVARIAQLAGRQGQAAAAPGA